MSTLPAPKRRPGRPRNPRPDPAPPAAGPPQPEPSGTSRWNGRPTNRWRVVQAARRIEESYRRVIERGLAVCIAVDTARELNLLTLEDYAEISKAASHNKLHTLPEYAQTDPGPGA